MHCEDNLLKLEATASITYKFKIKWEITEKLRNDSTLVKIVTYH